MLAVELFAAILEVKPMGKTVGSDPSTIQRFEAPRWWQSNIYGALAAGLAGAPVLSVYAYLFVSAMHGLKAILFATGFIAYLVLVILCMYPGNLIAWYPYAVEVEDGRGLRVFAPLKSVYIPLGNIKGVRWSWLGTGWRVLLNKREGLLSSFTIHAAFGAQGRELARVLQEEIGRKGSSR